MQYGTNPLAKSDNLLVLYRRPTLAIYLSYYTMRLITHNLLACHAAPGGKACVSPNNFPLNFQDVTRVEVSDSELNAEFLRGFVNKLDWNALVVASRQVSLSVERAFYCTDVRIS